MMRLKMPRDHYFYILLFAVGLAFIPLAAQARLSGSDFATDALNSMQSTNAGWKDLFDQTFSDPQKSTIWFIMRTFAQFVLGLASIFFIMRVTKEIASPRAQFTEIIYAIFILFFMLFLIGGSASPGLRLMNGSLGIKDYFLVQFMNQSIAGSKLARPSRTRYSVMMRSHKLRGNSRSVTTSSPPLCYCPQQHDLPPAPMSRRQPLRMQCTTSWSVTKTLRPL